MNVKDFLSQAWRVDRMINAKLEQVRGLRELAMKATSTLSDLPSNGSRNVHSMEDIITKILDFENEINADIKTLIDLKRDIVETIKRVQNSEYRTLLELRYLCFKPWNEIANDMRYNINSIFKMHRRALDSIKLAVKVVEIQ